MPLSGADSMRILRDGAIFSVIGSTCLLLLLRFHLRIFLGHFPEEIRVRVPPKSAKEQRTSILFGLLMGVPLFAGLLWRTTTLESRSFRDVFAYSFGVLFVFNVVDLVVLDWLIVCWIKPRWVILPGTEDIAVPNPYVHHFKEFLAGTVGLGIAGLAIAAFLHS